MSNATDATVTSRLEEVQKNPAFLLALCFMVTAASLANVIAGGRVARRKLEELSLKVLPVGTEFLSTSDAARFPITGSCVLFGLYVAFRYLPRDIINMILGAYLAIIAVASLAAAVKPAVGASPLVGTACIAVGAWYLGANHWIANNILAFGICVAGIESLPIRSFTASALLLCGLFVYDVFWVFGTDVMVTVAKSVQGPIKLLFPQDIFGDHEKKSLLGLGDIVIPGFFIMQMLRFALIRSGGRSRSYFYVAMGAYIASLVNTMFVMVVFNAAQPALLYIVPWLLLSMMLFALVRGELPALLAFDEELEDKKLLDRAEKECPGRLKDAKAAAEQQKEQGLAKAIGEVVLGVFGLDNETLAAHAKQRLAKMRRLH
jgi:minor histocompatibility antigen H13